MTTKEQMIRSTFTDLDDWGLRLQQPWRPDPGTPLETDDLDWPPFPVTQVAVAGLDSARDHLQAVRVHIDAGQLFPFAQSRLLRTAALAAAQAVWVLAPEGSAERVERARICVLEINDQHRKFLTDLQSLAPEPHEGTDKVAAHVATRLGELKALRAADGQTETFNATGIIRSAALSTFGDEAIALEAQVEWRRGSGAAHGLCGPDGDKRTHA